MKSSLEIRHKNTYVPKGCKFIDTRAFLGLPVRTFLCAVGLRYCGG